MGSGQYNFTLSAFSGPDTILGIIFDTMIYRVTDHMHDWVLNIVYNGFINLSVLTNESKAHVFV